jgi:hypothetical protein
MLALLHRYDRLLSQLDVCGPALRWRRQRAQSQTRGLSDELRLARALLRARADPRITAVLHARRTQPFIAPLTGSAIEYRVHWTAACQLSPEWVTATKLESLISAASSATADRLRRQQAKCEEALVPRSFSEFLDREGERELIGVAVAQPLQSKTAAARIRLLELFDIYAQEVATSEGRSARRNIQSQRAAASELEYSTGRQQTSFGGSGLKDKSTGKLSFGVEPSNQDMEAGRPAVSPDASLLPMEATRGF